MNNPNTVRNIRAIVNGMSLVCSAVDGIEKGALSEPVDAVDPESNRHIKVHDSVSKTGKVTLRVIPNKSEGGVAEARRLEAEHRRNPGSAQDVVVIFTENDGTVVDQLTLVNAVFNKVGPIRGDKQNHELQIVDIEVEPADIV
jgi:hypothetical protein